MNWIRAMRIARGMTQAELARRIGVSQTVVSLLESGDVIPSEVLRIRLRAVFGGADTEDRKMTQNMRVLEYMRENGSISQREAVAFGCYRLSARIHDLRRMGYTINTEKRPFKSEYGRGYYGAYSLVEAVL